MKGQSCCGLGWAAPQAGQAGWGERLGSLLGWPGWLGGGWPASWAGQAGWGGDWAASWAGQAGLGSLLTSWASQAGWGRFGIFSFLTFLS